MTDNVKTLIAKPSRFTTQLGLVTARIREMLDNMEGYVQKPGDVLSWDNLWNNHNVQVERMVIDGHECFSWADNEAEWMIMTAVEVGRCPTIAQVRAHTSFASWLNADVGQFYLPDGKGSVWLSDPAKVFDAASYDHYPPKVVHKHALDDLTCKVFSITDPTGNVIRVASPVLSAHTGSRISGIYTFYANGSMRYGYASAKVSEGQHRGAPGDRLVVVEITLRNKSDCLDGVPSGVSLRVLHQHPDYTTGPEIVLAQ